MKKHPVPKNEKARLQALRNYEILDSDTEYEFDRITELASLICNVPISLVSLVDEKRQWFKSSVGMDVRETQRDLAFCQYTILDTEIFEVPDAKTDDRFKDNGLVTGMPNISFYAGYPLIDPDGYALGSLCVIDREPKRLSDNQKRALQLLAKEVSSIIVERKLKKELKNFETLFELSNDLLFIGGIDGYFKKVNPAFTRVLGWSKEHLLNTSSFDFYHPDDIEKTKEQIDKLASGQNIFNFLQRLKTSSGDYKLIAWTSSPDANSGEIFGIGRDVSELREKEQQLADSEERQRMFFEHSQGLMCTHDLNGNFLSVNKAGAVTLGYSIPELKKMSLFDIVPVTGYEMLQQYLDKIKSDGWAKGEMITRRKDGSWRRWLYDNTIETPLNGNAYIIGNGVDITERHLLEQDLKRTSQMLERTNKVARVGGWEYNLVKKTIFWSSVTREIHGMPADYEPDLSTAINFYKDDESRKRIIGALNDAIKNGKAWDEELQIINAHGDEVWVRAIGDAEFENGVAKGFTVPFRILTFTSIVNWRLNVR